MPYIKTEDRKQFDALVAKLAEQLRCSASSDPTALAGNLNYSISTLLFHVYGASPRYHQHNEIVGMLECVKQEWYRRRTAPYEEVKIAENGDVFCR